MSKKMLIDATHPEETRVAVVDGQNLVEFDYESKVRQQLKGNIYLAKVTRVEPSLQAAFVNYGGNRHGFLPFSEIHPDYFRIPVSDREALLKAQQEELEKLDSIGDDLDDDEVLEVDDVVEETDSDDEEEEVVEVGGADKPADEEDSDLKKSKSKKKPKKKPKKASKKEAEVSEEEAEGDVTANSADEEDISDEELDAIALEKANALETPEDTEGNQKKNNNNKRRGRNNNKRGRNNKRANMRRKKSDEILDDSDKPFRFNLRHKYKIQEVVKRGQIVLIQVSKEERGNKGAAVTSYLSLPGRYCVLMPNSPRGGGVSRKIGNFKDRKRMREILKELEIPEGMSVILRTAGVSRTKAEIKRDLDYLLRLWNTIREDTLKSTAPSLINEEGNLIKRSIRDLYTRDIDDVLVSGAEGHKIAKDFMKMMVPSHAKKVTEYNNDRVPLFHRYHVEKQINEIGEISVTLKSGGYLVINPTEALVSIDVNSGKATKERHIEETALKTNMEAAAEVARQLRLRDLGGLVVIDFIDMEDRRNNRKVENKLRDSLSTDRARIQVGRISSFGLLELSRQRLNPSLTEAQFETCPHCQGSGTVKTLDFAAISAMRALEEEGIKNNVKELSLNLPNKVAVYILNNKRSMLAAIEERYNFRVHIRTDDKLMPSEFRLDIIAARQQKNNSDESAEEQSNENNNDAEENKDQKKKSRRRGRRGGRRVNRQKQNDGNDGDAQNNQDDAPKADQGDKKPVHTKKKQEQGKEKTDNLNQGSKKSPKKPQNKKVEKEPSSDAKAEKPNEKVKPPKASNDSKPQSKEQPSYETVNATPDKKKKGWWNKLID